MQAFQADITFCFLIIVSFTWVRSRTPDCKPCNFAACPPLPDGCKNGAALDICGCCYVCQEDPQKRCLPVFDSSAKKWSCYWKSPQRIQDKSHDSSYRPPEIFSPESNMMTKSNRISYPSLEDMLRTSKKSSFASKIKDSKNMAFNYEKSNHPIFGFNHEDFLFNKPTISDDLNKLMKRKQTIKDYDTQIRKHINKDRDDSSDTLEYMFSVINGNEQSSSTIDSENIYGNGRRKFISNQENFEDYLGYKNDDAADKVSTIASYLWINNIDDDASNEQLNDQVNGETKQKTISQFKDVNGERDLNRKNPGSVHEVYIHNDEDFSKTLYDTFSTRFAHRMPRGVKVKNGVIPTEDELKALEDVELNRREHEEIVNDGNVVERQYPFSYYPYHPRLGESQSHFWRAVENVPGNIAYGVSSAVANGAVNAVGAVVQGLLNTPMSLNGEGKFKVDNIPDGKFGKREVSDTELFENQSLLSDAPPNRNTIITDSYERRLFERVPRDYQEEMIMEEGEASSDRYQRGRFVRGVNNVSQTSDYGLLGVIQVIVKYVSNTVRTLTGLIPTVSVPTAVEISGLPGSGILASILKGVMQISNEVSSSISSSGFVTQQPTLTNLLNAAMDATVRGVTKAATVLPKIVKKAIEILFKINVAVNNTSTDVKPRIQGIEDSDRNVDKLQVNTYFLDKDNLILAAQKELKRVSTLIQSITGISPTNSVTEAIQLSGLPGASAIAFAVKEAMQYVNDITSSVLKSKFITEPTQGQLLDTMLDFAITFTDKVINVSLCALNISRKAFTEDRHLPNIKKHTGDQLKTTNSSHVNVFLGLLHKGLSATFKGIFSVTGFIQSLLLPIESSGIVIAKEVGEIVKKAMGEINAMASEFSKSSFLKQSPSWGNAKKFLVSSSKSVTIKGLQGIVYVLKWLKTKLINFSGNPTNIITEPVCNIDIPEGFVLHTIENAVDTIKETSPDTFLQFIHKSLFPVLKTIGKITGYSAMMIIPQAIRYSGVPMAEYIADAFVYSMVQLDLIVTLVSESDFMSNPSSFEYLSQLGINIIGIGLNVTREVMENTKDFFATETVNGSAIRFQNSALNAVVTWWWSALRALIPETYLTYIQGFLKHMCYEVQSLIGSSSFAAASVAIKDSGVPHADLIADSTVRVMRFLNELSVAASQSNFLAKEATWENAQISLTGILKLGITSGLQVTAEILENILLTFSPESRAKQ